jgi:hypothetical protein
MIEQEQKKLDVENKLFTKEVDRKSEVSYSKSKTKKGIISKLEDLDNGT